MRQKQVGKGSTSDGKGRATVAWGWGTVLVSAADSILSLCVLGCGGQQWTYERPWRAEEERTPFVYLRGGGNHEQRHGLGYRWQTKARLSLGRVIAVIRCFIGSQGLLKSA